MYIKRLNLAKRKLFYFRPDKIILKKNIIGEFLFIYLFY